MTKLSGTSTQTFSGLAESLNVRGAARGGKANATKSQGDGGFNDLLKTVSSLAKKAIQEQTGDTSLKTANLHARLAHPAEIDDVKERSVGRQDDASDESGTADDSHRETSGTKARQASHDGLSPDPAARTEAPDRPPAAPMSGAQIAATLPQIPSQSIAGKDVAPRGERAGPVRRADQAVPAKATDAAASNAASEPPRPASPNTVLPPQDKGTGETSPVAGSAFEAVSATIDRVVRATTRELQPEPTKVTVVQQETHLPPAQFGAPQQVANAVVAELKESAAPAAAALPDSVSSQGNLPEQPLRILTINLEPPALGNVTVRLRLVGSEVSVHLAAERKDTSQMLDQQRDSIRDLMQSAGYVADVAPVRHGSLDGFQSGAGQSQPQFANQQQASSQSQGAFGGAGSSPRQPDDGGRQARQDAQPNQETRHDQDVGPQLRRGPVYL